MADKTKADLTTVTMVEEGSLGVHQEGHPG